MSIDFRRQTFNTRSYCGATAELLRSYCGATAEVEEIEITRRIQRLRSVIGSYKRELIVCLLKDPLFLLSR